jgi:hypothetical protein
MAYRTFVDYAGTSWNAWDVLPAQVERRERERRLMNAAAKADEAADRRGVEDRRVELGTRAQLPPELVNGWVVFQSASLKRRYWPIPPGWENFSIGELADLCELARPVEPYPADIATLTELGTPNANVQRT